MVASFLRWWWHQLRSLLPRHGLQPPDPTGDALVIAPSTDGAIGTGHVMLGLQRKGVRHPLGQFASGREGLSQAREAASSVRAPRRILLQLDPDRLLEKRIELPIAAEHDIDRILGFEMDRETPFSADEVYWSAEVAGRDPKRGRLGVRLSLVPRAGLADLIDSLGRVGLRPTALLGVAPGNAARLIALDRHSEHDARGGRRLVPLLAGLCAVLGLIAIALPFVRQSRALTVSDSRIAALTHATDEAERLNRRIANAGGPLIAAERARLGDPLAVLAAVTEALPDDTYLTGLSFKAHKVSIVGQSASAARLLSALAVNPAFANAAFAAPVTKLEGTAQEAFTIEAETR